MRESDTLIDQTTLEAKIRRGIEEYEQGKVHRMEEGESVIVFSNYAKKDLKELSELVIEPVTPDYICV